MAQKRYCRQRVLTRRLRTPASQSITVIHQTSLVPILHDSNKNTNFKSFAWVSSSRWQPLRKNVTKDRKDSNAEREIPQAVFFAEIVFLPAQAVLLASCAGRLTARCPFRAAIAIATLRWHAVTIRSGFARPAESNGAQGLRRPAVRANQAALSTIAALATPLPIMSRVEPFPCAYLPQLAIILNFVGNTGSVRRVQTVTA